MDQKPKMASLKHVERTATFSFCQNAPFLAAGSVAGAIDLSFSNSSVLEVHFHSIFVTLLLDTPEFSPYFLLPTPS